MPFTSFISNCNRHGPRFLCAFTVLVAGAVQRLPYVLAGEISYLFSVDAFPIAVAVLCTSIITFYGPTKKALAVVVLLPIFLWWIWGLPYLSFPIVHARPRTPGFSSFTFALSSFSRRTAPSCGRVILSILPQVVAEILPSVVVVLVVLWWYSDEAVTVDVFEKNFRSVVFVSVGIRETERTQDEGVVHKGTGSGFVWDKKGHIVTNFHVIRKDRSESEDSEYKVFVKLLDGNSYEAKVIGCDLETDIAVLRVSEQAKNMTPINAGQSAKLRVGQKVYAIGNPFGLDRTLTTGVVSGLGRNLKSGRGEGIFIKDAIQTDASINPGSSGGPLLDSSGKLIGVNAAFCSPNGTSSGIGFSIGIDTVSEKVMQIIDNSWFVPEQSQQQNGHGGLLVCHVNSNSPAQKVFGLDHTLTTGVVSGLGRDLKSPRGIVIADRIQTDASIKPGSSGGPLLYSSGKLVDVNTTFCSPNGTSSRVEFSIGIETFGLDHTLTTGVVRFVSDQSQQQHGHGGLLVYHVDSNIPAQKAVSIQPKKRKREFSQTGSKMVSRKRRGMSSYHFFWGKHVIISFNGEIVNNGRDLYDLLDEREGCDKVKVQVLRAGETKELLVILG